jgi:hypothetical protein
MTVVHVELAIGKILSVRWPKGDATADWLCRDSSSPRPRRAGRQFLGSNAATKTQGGSVMNARCRVSLLVASSLLAGVAMIAPALARDEDDDRCAGARDVKLVNEKDSHS